jgi:hypothetical protein
VVAASRSIYGLSETERDLPRAELVALVGDRARAMAQELHGAEQHRISNDGPA